MRTLLARCTDSHVKVLPRVGRRSDLLRIVRWEVRRASLARPVETTEGDEALVNPDLFTLTGKVGLQFDAQVDASHLECPFVHEGK